jgi:DNA mismatch repair protein MutS
LTAEVLGVKGKQNWLVFRTIPLNTHLPKLKRAGERVAILAINLKIRNKLNNRKRCNRISNPGVAFNDDILHLKSNNFLAASFILKIKRIGVSF